MKLILAALLLLPFQASLDDFYKFRKGTTWSYKRLEDGAERKITGKVTGDADGKVQVEWSDPDKDGTSTITWSFSESLLTIEAGNADLLWHISQAYVDIGEHLPTASDEEKDLQLAAYEKALDFAGRSVIADPRNSMALTRRAIAVGHISLFKGLWETVGLLKDMRSDLDRAVAIDSTNHLGIFWLGRTHMRVTDRPWIFRWPLGLGWGSRTEALRLFERAIGLRGDIIEYRIEYAKGLVDEGEYEKARVQLLLIPNLPTQDEDDERYRREAHELYALIKDED